MKEALAYFALFVAGNLVESYFHPLEFAVGKAKAVYHALRGK